MAATLRGALVNLIQHRGTLLRALVLPSLAMAGLDAVQKHVTGSHAATAGSLAMYFALVTMFAVSCHRVLILGEAALPSRWGLFWSVRELRFVGWGVIFAFSIAGGAVLALLPLALLLVLLNLPDRHPAMEILVWLLAPLGLYYFSRCSLVFPAVATGVRVGLQRVLGWSHSLGWRLTLILWAPTLMLYVPHWAIDTLAQEGASQFFIVPLDAIAYLFGAIEVAVLSEAYRRLAADAPEASAATIRRASRSTP